MSGVSVSPPCRHVAWRISGRQPTPPPCPTTTTSPCTARGATATVLTHTHTSVSTSSRRSAALTAAAGPSSCGPVVDVAWLQRNLEEVRVFDARGRARAPTGPHECNRGVPEDGQEQLEAEEGADRRTSDYDGYLEGHVPGAVFVNWMRDGARGGDSPASREDRDDVARRLLALLHGQAQGQGGGGGEGVSSRPWQPAPLLLERDPDVYVPTFEARGLSMDMPVVVYDDGSCTTAARVWWALVAYGHPAAAVLAGGWRAWQAAGGEAELYEPCPLKLSTTYEGELQEQHTTCREEVLEAAAGARPGTVVVAVLPQHQEQQHQQQQQAAPDLPGVRTLALQQLLPLLGLGSPGHEAAAGAPGGGDPSTTAGQQQQPATHLAAELSRALGGLDVGPQSSTRVLLMGVDDVSGAQAALLLAAAGHKQWAVCDGVAGW